jgi:hypothetical protein
MRCSSPKKKAYPSLRPPNLRGFRLLTYFPEIFSSVARRAPMLRDCRLAEGGKFKRYSDPAYRLVTT